MNIAFFIRPAALAVACFAPNVHAIDVETYRKINRPGMTAAEVLIAAGHPQAKQRQENCETWFYPGTDYALSNRMVVVELCNNKVVSTATKLAF